MIHYSQCLWDRESGEFREGWFRVSAGRIEELQWGFPKGKQSMKDWGSLHVGPASVDLHVHSRDFEESHKESFESLEAACLKGGVVTGACLANTRPRLDSAARIFEFLKRAEKHRVEFIPFAAVTKNLEGKEDTDWVELLKLPIAGLSDDGKPILDEMRMRRVMLSLRGKNKLLSLHEEDLHLSCGSHLHESPAASFWGVRSSPSSAEVSLVDRDLRLLRELRVPLHFAHMSSKEGIALLREARAEGLAFSAELTPHHGLLSVEEVRQLSIDQLSQFKVCPPVRSAEDRVALQAAYREGVLDCFATDHAPHSLFEKQGPIESAWHGFSSIEWHFTLANELRRRTQISWSQFFRSTAERPAELLGRSGSLGVLKKGAAAHFLVFDPEAEVRLDPGASLNHNGPWVHRKLFGKLWATWISGEQAYENF